MKLWKTGTDSWIVDETVYLDGLTISKDAVVAAPEGKSLSLTVDGIEKNIAPGQYQGDIVITVTDEALVPYKEMLHPFRAALFVEDGKVSDKSVKAAILDGCCEDRLADGLKIVSHGDTFNCVYITGEGDYTIRNAHISAQGTGGNDFCGWGSALTTHGTAKVLVEDSVIETVGAAKNAVVTAGDSEVVFRNCQLHSKNGTLPHDYEDTIQLGVMKSVPWMLGLRGNCRTTNLCKNAKVTYENCHLSSAGWGVLSVDDLDSGVLTVKDSLIEITGPSGYGAFSIGDVKEIFDHSTIRVPDYGLIGAMGDQYYTNGTVIEAGRNALTSTSKGVLKADKGCVFKSGMTTLLNKGGASTFLLEDCVLQSRSGVLFQTTISDDPRSPTGYYIDPKDPDVRDDNIDIYSYVKGDDTLLQLTGMDVEGDIFNSTTQQKADTGKPMMMGPPPAAPAGDGEAPAAPGPMMAGKQGARNLMVELIASSVTGVISASASKHRVEKITKENCGELGIFIDTPQPAVNNGVIVSLDSSSRWIVTGDSHLTKLMIADGAVVAAPEGKSLAVFVDGSPVEHIHGELQGQILLTVR